MKDLHSASAYDYVLPDDRIAATPAGTRSASRLLGLGEESFADLAFSDLPLLLEPGDLLVVNDARVSPVRLRAHRASGGRVEVFVVGFGKEGVWNDSSEPLVAMLRSNRRVAEGEILSLGEHSIRVEKRMGKLARCQLLGADPWAVLASSGTMPLPPYIQKRRRDLDEPVDRASDRERYQTIFARSEGAVAAPTAGLHFDEATMRALETRGVEWTQVTLHVGIGTFAPVQVERLEEHEMHTEHFEISEDAAALINAARREGRRVIAVGTTVVRTLESAVRAGQVVAGAGSTELFIRPGFSFQVIDGLVTNFHLPRSTLLSLVAAFCGYERVMAAYDHAVSSGYRFYSYGDAMFAWRDA